MPQWWTVENFVARRVVYCASFEDAVEEMEVQMLEDLAGAAMVRRCEL